MCSNEADDELTIMMNKQNINVSDVCKKCSTTGSHIILREKDVYCNACFLTYFTHKFRATIGKSKEIKPYDKVLISYSGGKNSSVLLNLVLEGLAEPSHKKLRFEPSFLFINDLALYPSESPIDANHNIFKLNFPFYYVHLEEVFSQSKLKILKSGENECSTTSNKEKCPYIEEFHTLTSKIKNSASTYEDVLMQLKNELICRCAKQLGFKKVFLGENGTNLSIRILSDIAIGRGSQLSGHVHFKSTHFDVDVYRPMREVLEDEIDYFVNINNICIPFKRKLKNDNIDSNFSINSCTKNFVLGLQKEFPATIPTIFKTGNKLIAGNFHLSDTSTSATSTTISEISNISHIYSEPDIALPEKENLCIFCGSVKDTNQGTSSALEAVNISKLMSSLQPPTAIFSKINSYWEENRCKEITEKLYEVRLSEEDAIKHFCYGCRKILKELDSVDYLPARVFADFNLMQQKENQNILTKEFLL